MTDLKQYVLRFWEKEFPNLHPEKNSAGNRVYRAKDIEIIRTIKELLYSRKYTIEGARQYFRQSSKNQLEIPSDTPEPEFIPAVDIEVLKKLRRGLNDLLKILTDYKSQ